MMVIKVKSRLVLFMFSIITFIVVSIFIIDFYSEQTIQDKRSFANANSQKNKEQKQKANVEVMSGYSSVYPTTTCESQNNKNWIAIDRKDNYNEELQYYCKQNVEFDNGGIVLYARKENKQDRKYTSGQAETTAAYLYGKFEFTIKINEGNGLFPAIWMLPLEDKEFPEIDIFEMIGSNPQNFYGVIHFEQKSALKRDYFCYRVKPSQTYHIGFNWSKDALEWFIDGKSVYKTKKYVPQDYMYLIVNLAVGGTWPGNPDENTVFPAKFEIVSFSIKPENEVQR
jgi:beta-glucanase (GH16 family)